MRLFARFHAALTSIPFLSVYKPHNFVPTVRLKKLGCALYTRCDLHTHCVEVCLVTSAIIYTRVLSYATHVLVTMFRESALCGLCKNIHKG